MDPIKKINQYAYDSWGMGEGLPEDNVRAVLQTKDGYLWAGTDGGLARFDGVRFEVFDKQKVKQLTNDWIGSLCEDRRGNLWMGSTNGIFRMKNGQFTNYNTKDGLAVDMVNTIYEDSSGNLWIGTDNGLDRMNDGKFTHFNIENGLSNKIVIAIHEDRNGNLWIGTKKGLNRLKDGKFTSYNTRHGLVNDLVNTIYEDRAGNLWIGTEKALSRMKDGKFTNYNIDDGLANTIIHTLLEDRDGILWIGTEKGLSRMIDGKFSNFKFSRGLAKNAVHSICEDREGNLWFGSWGLGLNRIRDGKLTSFDSNTGLGGNTVYPLFQDREGSLWFGTFAGGLSRVKDGTFTTYTTKHGLNHNEVICIRDDRMGNLWVGTRAGLNRLKNGKISSYTTRDGLAENFISTLYEDREGALWIGTRKSLHCIINGNISTLKTLKEPANKYINILHEDRQGNLWIGTWGDGLYLKKEGNISIYDSMNKLPNGFVFNIIENREGIWFSLWCNGLFRLKNGKLSNVSTKNGLLADDIYMLLEDSSGNYWMNSNKGIFSVNKNELNSICDGNIEKKLEIVSYDEQDGINRKYTDFSQAGVKDRDGKLWFATIRGAVMIDPANIEINRLMPPVLIEKISASDGMELRPPFVKQVLAPGTEQIEIHYTGLSFTIPGRVRFKTKLEGLDTQWWDVDTRRAAYYSNIPPGHYTFRVKACNNDGIWNETGASASFYLKPYFYQTDWFRLVCIFAVGLLAAGIYIRIVNRLKKQREKLELLVKERTFEIENRNTEIKKRNEEVLKKSQELEKANETARRERESADKANHAKSDFLARMSHEIRTPMNGILGFADILKETGLKTDQADYVGIITRSGEALTAILNDILDFSKIEAGELTFDPVDFDPEVTACDVCDILKPRLDDKPVEVFYHVDDNVPGLIKQDPGRFRQVLMNLMGNAAKFTNEGEIVLSLSVAEETKERLKLHVRVKDTGIGIPEDKLESIFDVFQQADGSTTRKYGGTGLGLSICKQIAKMMDGDVWAESSPGKGSTFHFTAWVELPSKKPGKEIYANLSGKKALLADDNLQNLALLEHMLTAANMRIIKVSDSGKIVETLRRGFDENSLFDIAILDIAIPGKSGCDIAKEIRQMEPPYSGLPLLAFSSTINRTRDYLKLGFDGFLPKPVRKETLLSMLARLLGEKESHGDSKKIRGIVTQHSIIDNEKHSTRILLADDNPINRKLARFMLTKAGYTLTIVEDGRQAVDTYTAAPLDFDLILMDIQMPDINGMDASRLIREQEMEWRNLKDSEYKCDRTNSVNSGGIPIIALTAQVMKGDMEHYFKAGMNDFIPKPVKREVVFAMIKKWVLG
ncbi:MAG: response regulator [bacterium]|nr:response regulator [bacterium]